MWFFGLIVVLLIGAVAVVASGRWGAMSTAYDDRPDMTVPARQALTSTDIESARFAVGLRGYRMDEVDTLLERVAKEVAERDRRIADLERAVAPIVDAPDGAGFTSRGTYDPADFDDTGAQKPILVGGNFPDAASPDPGTPSPESSTDQPPPPRPTLPRLQSPLPQPPLPPPRPAKPTPRPPRPPSRSPPNSQPSGSRPNPPQTRDPPPPPGTTTRTPARSPRPATPRPTSTSAFKPKPTPCSKPSPTPPRPAAPHPPRTPPPRAPEPRGGNSPQPPEAHAQQRPEAYSQQPDQQTYSATASSGTHLRAPAAAVRPLVPADRARRQPSSRTRPRPTSNPPYNSKNAPSPPQPCSSP